MLFAFLYYVHFSEFLCSYIVYILESVCIWIASQYPHKLNDLETVYTKLVMDQGSSIVVTD
jgi:hypothetical protein